MKPVKSITFLLIALVSVSLINAQQIKKATLSFDSEEINYGKIAQNADGERTFAFSNTGDAPLVISKVKTSCGCTVPTYPAEAILPGETGEIIIRYDTKRLGAFTKTITVVSNAKESSKVLKIKGEVLKSSS